MHKIHPSAIAVLSDATIKAVIEKLNASSEKIVAVLDDKNRMLGVITDGDVRRAILKDNNLDRPALDIISLNPVSVNASSELYEVRNIMTKRKIEHIPVLDDQGVLLYVFRSVPQLPQLDCEAIIMAGGQGKRLRPYTETTPKPLMRIGDKTIIEALITHLTGFGVSKFRVSVNYLANQVEELLGTGAKFGVDIQYLREEEKLGTAGSLALIKNRPEANFIVLNGDITTKINIQDLLEAQNSSDAIATVAVTANEYTIPYGVVVPDADGKINWQEKPSLSYLVSIGVYALSPRIFDYLSDTAESIDMPELLLRAQEDGQKIDIFTVYETWRDIGTPNDLVSARQSLE